MILLPSQFRTQPQTTVSVDWSNPLTQRMTFAWTASNRYRESVVGDSKNYGVNDSAIVNGIGSPRGIVQRTSADGAVIWGLHGRTVNAQNNEFTIGCAFQVRNLAANNTDVFVVTNPGSAFNRVGLVASKVRGSTTQANTTVDSDNTVAVGDWVYAVYVLKNGDFQLYVNGVKQAAVGTGVLPTLAVPYNRVEINPSRVNLLTAFIVTRPWDQTQVSAWSSNPWQIFKPGIRRSYFLPSAPGTLSADSGAYSLTGIDATLSRLTATKVTWAEVQYQAPAQALTLAANSGAYSLVGSDATLNRTRSLSADSGAYSLTGADATLFRSLSVSADSGSYQIDGKDASLTQAKVISADSGSYQVDGQAAAFIRTYNLLADAGAFNVTGSDATLATAKTFSAGAGAYSLTGASANLIKFSLYPDPGDVREGVVYGPGGIYVGTLKVGGKVLYIFDD